MLDALSRDRVLYRVDTPEPWLAITIDDGPHPQITPAYLEVLARHEAKATFFVIGERAATHPELLARIRREGHELGNHLQRDAPSILLSAGAFTRSLRETHGVLEPLGPIRWFRPGAGWYDEEMLEIAATLGYRAVLASSYPLDNKIPHSGFIARSLILGARPGAILVLHDGHPARRRSVEALDQVLAALPARGLRAVTLSELVASRHDP
jgi:peptidoglycan/xylan/chitin deacetylase (PgdA/CDA1 family)